MDISTKTTRTHTAVAKTDEFKDVAILAVKRKLGLSDSAVISATASTSDDGSISVEVVESVDTSVEASKGSREGGVPDTGPDLAEPDAPSIPVTIGS